MFCIKCGTVLPDDANFCFKCGCDLRNLNPKSGMDKFTIKCVKHPTAKPMRVNVGEYVKFGRYPQNNDNYKEPIEWLVLEVESNEALLVSRYGLDRRQYHQGVISMTWEQCDLRNWLNHDFLKSAFTAEEQRRIKISDVVNVANPEYGTSGGNNTQDRVFCLSIAEAERYFKNDGKRRCRLTPMAEEHGAGYGAHRNCWWWLRSPGDNQNYASGVRPDGSLCLRGDHIYDISSTVRPALRLICNL